MKKLLKLITILFISSNCHAVGLRGTGAPGKLPQFEEFMRFPDVIKGEVFSEYLGPTIPQIYKNLSVWNQVNKYFKDFAQTGQGSQVVDQKINSILGIMRKELAGKSLSEKGIIINPSENPIVNAIFQEAKTKPYEGYQKIRQLFSELLCIVAGTSDTVSLMQLLLKNGADINYVMVVYGTPLEHAVKESISRIYQAVRGEWKFNSLDELRNLKYLLAHGAIDRQRYEDQFTALDRICFDYWSISKLTNDPHYFNKNNLDLFLDQITDYQLKTADLLLDHNSPITRRVKERALLAQQHYNRPELYDLVKRHMKLRTALRGVEVTY